MKILTRTERNFVAAFLSSAISATIYTVVPDVLGFLLLSLCMTCLYAIKQIAIDVVEHVVKRRTDIWYGDLTE